MRGQKGWVQFRLRASGGNFRCGCGLKDTLKRRNEGDYVYGVHLDGAETDNGEMKREVRAWGRQRVTVDVQTRSRLIWIKKRTIDRST